MHEFVLQLAYLNKLHSIFILALAFVFTVFSFLTSILKTKI